MSDPKWPVGEARAAGASPVYHGGALAQARASHPDAPTPWIDLSTGINPHVWPVPDLPAEVWTRLPDPAEATALEEEAAQAFGVHPSAGVVATPGTQAAIQMLPRLVPSASVAILGFTYQEHAHCWRAAGREVRVVDDLDALAEADVGILVNPNNPDGRLIDPQRLSALALDMSARGRRLIVDEAFVDVLPDEASIAPRLPLGSAVVLRSFGKTWGLAGVRLGFVVAEAGFADRLRAAFGPWAVSGPAVAIGRAALADRPWLEAMRVRLDAEMRRLDAVLAAGGLEPLGGTPLFRLAASPRAEEIRRQLASAGIHIRHFPHDSRLLRFGLPGAESEWRRLVAALDGVCGG